MTQPPQLVIHLQAEENSSTAELVQLSSNLTQNFLLWAWFLPYLTWAFLNRQS